MCGNSLVDFFILFYILYNILRCVAGWVGMVMRHGLMHIKMYFPPVSIFVSFLYH